MILNEFYIFIFEDSAMFYISDSYINDVNVASVVRSFYITQQCPHRFSIIVTAHNTRWKKL